MCTSGAKMIGMTIIQVRPRMVAPGCLHRPALTGCFGAGRGSAVAATVVLRTATPTSRASRATTDFVLCGLRSNFDCIPIILSPVSLYLFFIYS